MNDKVLALHVGPDGPPASILRIYHMLDDMATWKEGWNTYNALPPNPLALVRAREWIAQFYKVALTLAQLSRWIQPSVTATAHGDIVFDWHNGEKDLEIIVDEDGESISYLKVWGPNVSAEMDDGDITSMEDAAKIYAWLFA